MLELWVMWSTFSLPLFPCSQVWPEVVVPEKVLSIGRIELFDI